MRQPTNTPDRQPAPHSATGIQIDGGDFGAVKEAELRAESETWDTRSIHLAREGDIPIIDLSDYLNNGDTDALAAVAQELRTACTEVGFYSLIGHGVTPAQIKEVIAQTRRFHDQPIKDKVRIAMDQSGAIPGIGYLPVGHRKLPRRSQGNLNEAFIIKKDHRIDLADNLWPRETDLPGFRTAIESYALAMEQLACALLPVYAVALGVEPNYFATGFAQPFYRLRLTHYPAESLHAHQTGAPGFGIAPHVDTTFITLLAQDSPGLCVFSEARQRWIEVPLVENALIVNTGELLKQWSNDEFLSVKHFANANTNVNANASAHPNTDTMAHSSAAQRSRYSVPFFFNAHPDYPMHCLPSCCGVDRPAKYPAISYAQSQGVIQGE